jgi:hypothetical protein
VTTHGQDPCVFCGMRGDLYDIDADTAAAVMRSVKAWPTGSAASSRPRA